MASSLGGVIIMSLSRRSRKHRQLIIGGVALGSSARNKMSSISLKLIGIIAGGASWRNAGSSSASARSGGIWRRQRIAQRRSSASAAHQRKRGVSSAAALGGISAAASSAAKARSISGAALGAHRQLGAQALGGGGETAWRRGVAAA